MNFSIAYLSLPQIEIRAIYSQADALHRLLLSWVALGAVTVVLMIVIGIFLKRKDVRV